MRFRGVCLVALGLGLVLASCNPYAGWSGAGESYGSSTVTICLDGRITHATCQGSCENHDDEFRDCGEGVCVLPSESCPSSAAGN